VSSSNKCATQLNEQKEKKNKKNKMFISIGHQRFRRRSSTPAAYFASSLRAGEAGAKEERHETNTAMTMTKEHTHLMTFYLTFNFLDYHFIF